MDWPPEVRYARSPDGTHLGYAVVSEGDRTILAAIGLGTHLGIDLTEHPAVMHWYDRLAALGQLIVYDQRGAGVSDPVAVNALPSADLVAEDMGAVLDAAGAERAAIVATTSLGPAAMHLAASRPERVSALVLYGTYSRMRAAPDYPWGFADHVLDWFAEFSRDAWGTGAMVELLAPSLVEDVAYRELFARVEKLSISPTQSAILARMGSDYDVRHVLGAVNAPTLVIHRTGDQFVPVAHGRFLAEHIPGARMVEFEGEDHAFYAGDFEALLDEIEEFLTGERSIRPVSRVLATVLFTDIVGSTDAVTRFGDQRWRDLLDRHDAAGRRQIERFGGKLVKTTGDGLLARFEAPTKAVLCAAAVRDAVKAWGLDVRAGVHTGEVELRGDDIGGIGVHIAARVADRAEAGEVWVSRTVRDLATGSGLEFASVGSHALKGVAEDWELFRLTG